MAKIFLDVDTTQVIQTALDLYSKKFEIPETVNAILTPSVR
jgi:hypothetical protein